MMEENEISEERLDKLVEWAKAANDPGFAPPEQLRFQALRDVRLREGSMIKHQCSMLGSSDIFF